MSRQRGHALNRSRAPFAPHLSGDPPPIAGGAPDKWGVGEVGAGASVGPMGIGDKAEELKGKLKAAVGDATDNRQMEAEGKVEEMSGKAKQETESVVDALRDAADANKGDNEPDRV